MAKKNLSRTVTDANIFLPNDILPKILTSAQRFKQNGQIIILIVQKTDETDTNINKLKRIVSLWVDPEIEKSCRAENPDFRIGSAYRAVKKFLSRF